MKNKSIFVLMLFAILIAISGIATATLYVATGQVMYKASNDATFIPQLNLTNHNNITTLLSYTPYLNQSNITKIASSDDDKFIYVIAKYNATLFYLLESTDSGASFSVHYSVANNYTFNDNPVTMIKTSDSGQYIVFATYIPGPTNSKIYISNDYGSSYQLMINTTSPISNFDISDDGKYITFGYGANNLYAIHSSDYGQTFATTLIVATPANFFNCNTVGISQDGQYQFIRCGYAAGFLYNNVYSTNYGINWSYQAATAYQQTEDYPNTEIYNQEYIFVRQLITNYASNLSATLSSTTNNVHYLVGTKNLNTLYTTLGNSLLRFDNKNISIYTNITQFSNNITAINYNSNTQTPITPACIDYNTYCSIPYILYGNITSCNYANILNCAQGCYEENGIATCHNVCSNQCNVIGSTSCNDTTTVSKCDDWNGDDCYEIQPYLNCEVGSYCLASGNYLASCTNVTQNGTHQPFALNVVPYTTNSNNVSYTNHPETRTVDVNTIFSVHNQQFYSTGTTYIARTCDYSEIDDYSQGYINVTESNNSEQILSNALSTDTIIRLKIRPSQFGEGTIYIKDSLGANNHISYKRNFTAKNICIYDESMNIIYCDYSTNTYDDLDNLQLEYSYMFSSKTYTIKMIFNRQLVNTIIRNPLTTLNDNIYAINITSTNGTVELLETIIKSPTPYTSFTSNGGGTTQITIIDPNCYCGTLSCAEYKLTFGNTKYVELCSINQTIPNFVKDCIYTTTGNHIARTYGNNLGIPDYSNYIDYNINIINYGLTEQQLDIVANNPSNDNAATTFMQGLFGLNATSSQASKIWVATLLIIIVFLFTLFGIWSMTGSGELATLLGTIFSIILFIIFAILGFYPAWIVIIIFIITAAILIVFARKMFIGD